jgi:predicted aspartyl protease
MGNIFVEGIVTGPTGKQATVRLLVDSGAIYTLLPDEVWRAIELQPKRQMDFVLADGTTIARPVSEAHIALAQGDGTSPRNPGRTWRRSAARRGDARGHGPGLESV